MDRAEFHNLVERYLGGIATPEEEKRLLTYYDRLQSKSLNWDEDLLGSQSEIEKRLYTKISLEIRDPGLEKNQRTLLLNWSIAASVLIAMACGVYFYNSSITEPESQKVVKSIAVNEKIIPGQNKAILTLSDGRTVILDETKKGEIAAQGNMSVTKNANGQLIYQVATSTAGVNDTQVFNTITTPSGGQYQVILSDGTSVWLNAESEIKFPVAFTSQERTIEIKGEAYFEVEKDSRRPFKVISDNQTVEVLGTHFNISAYPDDAEIKTTLVEGSVKVTTGTSSRIIKPGQQAQLLRNHHRINISAVDTEDAVAWKNGFFVFDNEDLHSIMRRISRWYNVEIVYENNNIDERFGGMISRSEKVTNVLKILEVTGTVRFKIEGRRIIVMQ